MRAVAQITITNICDVVTTDTAPENPYVGMLFSLVSSTLFCRVRILFQNLSQNNAPERPPQLAEINFRPT